MSRTSQGNAKTDAVVSLKLYSSSVKYLTARSTIINTLILKKIPVVIITHKLQLQIHVSFLK